MSEHNWILSSEALSEWRENPVTEILREAMRRQIEARKAWLCEAYLLGNPAPEADRQAVHLVEAWVEDFFESSAEDVMAAMEKSSE